MAVRRSVPATAIRPEIPLPPLGLLIDGTWQESSNGATFEVIAPTTEETIADVSAAGAADVDAAVQAARQAFDAGPWARLSGMERARIMHELANLIARDETTLSRLEMLEVGQPSTGAASAIQTLRYFAGWADKVEGRYVPVPDQGGRRRLAYTRREPVGVLAAITPWNAPLMIMAWKLAPALAAGCTVVLKPSEDAPLATLHLAALVEEAGFPPGVINVIPGLGHEAGAMLVAHPGVDKVSFTGSPEVGREIATVAAASARAVTLELGGKSPQIIFADADVDALIPSVARSFYARSGQICSAGTRILVQSPIETELAAGLARVTGEVRIGDPFEPGTMIGALINESQLSRVMGYIQTGVDEGAELISGGRRLDRRGYFVEPTLFRGTNELRISQEEIFGPVATLIPFSDPAEAIELANATLYGLAATIWTRDLAQAHITAERLRVGSIRINGAEGVDPSLPWGGMKASGLGRELGFSGIEACTEEKAITIAL